MTFFPDLTQQSTGSPGYENYDNAMDENTYRRTIPGERGLMKNPLSKNPAESNPEEEKKHNSFRSFYLKDFKNKTNKQNLISPTKIIFGEELRTTILIKNVPKSYYPSDLLAEIISVKEFAGKFNFFYLPFDEVKGENYGFAIINFVHPLHILLFYEVYQKKTFKKFITGKHLHICFFSYSKIYKENVQEETEFLLPLKWLELFKKIHKNSVCIVKEINIYNDGTFLVKNIGKNLKM